MIDHDLLEEINDVLDELYDTEFSNPIDAWQEVCLVLEEYGLAVPILEEGVAEEMEFVIVEDGSEEETDFQLYTAIDEDGGKYRIFATIGDDSDMEALDLIGEESPEE